MLDFQHRRMPFVVRFISAVIIISFLTTTILPPGYAQTIGLTLPLPGSMVGPSAEFVPVLLKGMTVHPDNPLQFEFIIDSGHEKLKEAALKKESERLVKYFLASMTVPQNDLWVNLSPYEKDRIIPDELGKTELGRDLLSQDYILKQLTATLMYPEEELGKKFWDRMRKLAKDEYGLTEIPTDVFNKVWILPETATVYEYENTVYIVESKLKVMLEQDYFALQNNTGSPEPQPANGEVSPATGELAKKVIKEIILPQIEIEVNKGKNFAPLRQIYHSLILAKWYKQTVKNSLMSQVYIDKNKTVGIAISDTQMKERIYDQYMQAYKKGVFNYIKEDYDALSQTVIPKQYFSGGFKDSAMLVGKTTNAQLVAGAETGPEHKFRVNLKPERPIFTMLRRILRSEIPPEIPLAIIIVSASIYAGIVTGTKKPAIQNVPPIPAVITDPNAPEENLVAPILFEYNGMFFWIGGDNKSQTNFQSETTDAAMLGLKERQQIMDAAIKKAAAHHGITVTPKTKIALFIGEEHIFNGRYYAMFRDIIGKYTDMVYLPFPIAQGKEELLDVAKAQLEENDQIIGAVITRPWKTAFFEQGDNQIGAVNYIVKQRDGSLVRSAVDGTAWINGLNRNLGHAYDFTGKNIVIVGTGGAARELAEALNQKGVAIITFADSVQSQLTDMQSMIDRLVPDYNARFLQAGDPRIEQAIANANIVINATGVGRGTTLGQSPVANDIFKGAQRKSDLIVSDLISNTETQFLKDAQAAVIQNVFTGRSMYIFGMIDFMTGWLEQAGVPVPTNLYEQISDWLDHDSAMLASAATVAAAGLMGAMIKSQAIAAKFLGEAANDGGFSSWLGEIFRSNQFLALMYTGVLFVGIRWVWLTQTVNGNIHRLEKGESIEKRLAAEKLGELGDKRALEPLIKALSDSSVDVSSVAARALGKIGDKRAVEPLIEALSGLSPDVRSAAAAALGKLGDNRAVESLIMALSESTRTLKWGKNDYVILNLVISERDVLIRSLKKFDDARAIEALNCVAAPVVDVYIDALKSTSADTRRFAAMTLDKLGEIADIKNTKVFLSNELEKWKNFLSSDLAKWKKVAAATVTKLDGMSPPTYTETTKGHYEEAGEDLSYLGSSSGPFTAYAWVEESTYELTDSEDNSLYFKYEKDFQKARREIDKIQDVLREISRIEGKGRDSSDAQQNDKAMLSAPGGIDMNEIAVGRANEEGAKTIQFDMEGMEPLLNMDIQGFSPIIIDMVPINSVLPLLGLAPTEKGIKYGQEEVDAELELSLITN